MSTARRAEPALAVVTGASSGIGAALARTLARRGHDLVLVARRADLLDALAAELAERHGTRSDVCAVDLTDRAARAALAAQLAARPVDVLCNNAGVASFGAVRDLPTASLRAELELDVTAVHDLTLAVLPGMLARGRGGLLFSGSVAGNLPIPHNATYAAGKAFVNHFAEALHHELAGTGVAVTLLAPGPVHAARAGADRAGTRSGIRMPVPERWWASADQAARLGLAGLDRNRLRVVPGAMGTALSLVSRHGPRRVLSPLAGRVYRRLATATA